MDYGTAKIHQGPGAQRVPVTGCFESQSTLISSLCRPETADLRLLMQPGILRNKDERFVSLLSLSYISEKRRKQSLLCFCPAASPGIFFPLNAILGFTTSMTKQKTSCLSLWKHGRKHSISETEQRLPKECEWILFRFILNRKTKGRIYKHRVKLSASINQSNQIAANAELHHWGM